MLLMILTFLCMIMKHIDLYVLLFFTHIENRLFIGQIGIYPLFTFCD